ncbi:hypothetical protein QBC44DRAFT_312965 [Cladorrhinum sp. PSN332]|nr:hypothetical protein QBC44DRAFT_312965 [Cladorrhinum sp. PSN332]
MAGGRSEREPVALVVDSVPGFDIIWPHLDIEDGPRVPKIYARYLDYLRRELFSIGQYQPPAITAPGDFLSLIAKLQSLSGNGIMRTEAIHAVRELVVEEAPSDDQLLRAVDIAVRVWLTVDVSSFKWKKPGLLTWNAKDSLSEVIQSHFNSLKNQKPRNLHKHEEINPDFTAHSLVKYHGYQIIWTDNLVEHLTIDWKSKTLTVYEHKICLNNHLSLRTSLIPREVLGEALDTLNLLFPDQDKRTQRFLDQNKRPFYRLGLCKRPRKLSVDHYSYWRHQIADLVHIMAGPPVGLQQLGLYYKGENLLQFTTFWIATAVGVFTLLGIALGIASTVYGFKSYKLALKQAYLMADMKPEMHCCLGDGNGPGSIQQIHPKGDNY